MLNRFQLALGLTCVAVLASVQPASAQQTINFNLGKFALRGEDARVEGDVLNVNRTLLAFDVSDFNQVIFGVEWLVPIGRYFEGGAGIGFSRRTVESVYLDFVEQDGSEIEQELRLRLIPMTFSFRALPLGQDSPVQPYVGAGLGIFNWRYTEVGDFIDFGAGDEIFPAEYVASGNATGPIVLGGVRFAGDTFSAGGEIRYQRASGDLDDIDFLGPKLDLGGWTYLATFGVRFGR